MHPVILMEEMEESAKRENVQMYVKQTNTSFTQEYSLILKQFVNFIISNVHV